MSKATTVTLTSDRSRKSVDVPATQRGRNLWITMSDYLTAKASLELASNDLLVIPVGVGVLA